MKAACTKEVIELHQFFETWFTSGDADFKRFSGAMDPTFTITFPTGGTMALAPLSERVHSAKNAYKDGQFRIEIVIKDFKPLGSDHAVLMYEEWHITGDKREGRISSAVFRVDAKAPAGVAWVHLHETPL